MLIYSNSWQELQVFGSSHGRVKSFQKQCEASGYRVNVGRGKSLCEVQDRMCLLRQTPVSSVTRA